MTQKAFALCALVLLAVGAVASSVYGQTVTTTVSGSALDVTNDAQKVLAAKLACVESGGVATTITAVTLTPGGTGDDATDISTVAFYVGDVTEANKRTTGATVKYAVDNTAATFTFDTAIPVAANATVNIYVMYSLAATADAAETFTAAIAVAGHVAVSAGASLGTGTAPALTIQAAASCFYITKVEYSDLNGNGRVDAVHIFMSNQVDDATVIPSQFAVTDVTDAVAFPTGSNSFSGTTQGDVVNDPDFWIGIDETAGSANTGNNFEVVYTQVASKELKNLLNTVMAATQLASVVDLAPPAIWTASTADNDANGMIDRIIVIFSELVQITDGSALDGFDGFLVSDGYVIADVDYAVASNNTQTFLLVESGSLDTGIKPVFTYTIAGVNVITDHPGGAGALEMADGETYATTDNSPPLIISATTIDTNPDGLLDALRILFSEAVRMDDADQGKFDPAGDVNTQADYSPGADSNDLRYGTTTPMGGIAPGTGGAECTADIVDVNEGFIAINAAYTLAPYAETSPGNPASNIITLSLTGPGTKDTGTFTTIDVRYGVPAGDEFEDLANLPVAANLNVTEVDGAPPTLYAGITQDVNGDGKLDKFILSASEAIKTGLANYATGFTIVTQIAGKAGQAYSFTAAYLQTSPPDNSKIVFDLDKLGGAAIVENTSDKPQVTYSGGLIQDANGVALANITVPLQCTDGAPPVIFGATHLDVYKNTAPATLVPDGSADKVRVDFSEDLVSETSAQYIAGFDYSIGGSDITLGSATKTANPDGTCYLLLVLDPVDVDIPANNTDLMLAAPVADITYSQAAGQLKDASGALVLGLLSAANIEKDGACPLAISAQTLDLDMDGRMDHLRVTCTEKVDDSSFDGYVATDTAGNVTTKWAVAGYANVRFDSEVPADVDDDDTFYLGFDEGGYDTDALPELTTNGAVLTDPSPQANAIVPIVSTGVEANNVTETDLSPPVLYQAIGQVASTKIRVHFSEPAFNLGLGTDDFAYNNVSDVGTNATAISAAAVTQITTEVYIVQTDVSLTTDDVVNDMLKFSGTVDIVDGVGNAAIILLGAVEITIDDVLAPFVTGILTIDSDQDGWVDYLRVAFSEAINDASLFGYVVGDSLSGSVASHWDVAGFAGEQWNLYDYYGGTDADADGINDLFDAAVGVGGPNNLAMTRPVDLPGGGFGEVTAYFSAVEAGAVAFDDNGPDDDVLYLALDESSGAASAVTGIGNTDAAPGVGVTAPTLADFKPNILDVASSATTAVDGAGPALMLAGAVTDHALTVTFSEDVTGVSVWDFDLYMGLFNYTGAQYMYIEEISPGVVYLKVAPVYRWNRELTGSIYIDGWSLIFDVVGNGNCHTASVVVAAVTVQAPASLTVCDVPNDNGGWVQLKFPVSASDLQGGGYIIQRQVPDCEDTTLTKWELWATCPDVAETDISLTLSTAPYYTLVTDWGVTAVAGDAFSAMTQGGVPKLGDGLISTMTVGTGGAVDNIAPAPPADLRAVDNPGDEGGAVLLSWTLSPDDQLISSTSDLSGRVSEIYGVTGYEIWRDGEAVAVVDKGLTSYVDVTDVNNQVFEYLIKALDYSNAVEAEAGAQGFAAINIGVPIGDFTSDNAVGLADFVLFVDHYGLTSEDPTWDALYDLDPDDVVGLSDFVTFVDHYGETGTGKAIPMAWTGKNANTSLALEATQASGDQIGVLVNLSGASELRAYSFTVSFDADKVEFVSASASGANLLNSNGAETPLLLVVSNEPGQVTIANAIAGGGTVSGSGSVGELVFNIKGDELGLVSISEACLADAGLSLNPVEELGSLVLSLTPTVFCLQQNCPNPFNPSTAIQYELPEASDVRLEIYDVVGQLVRTLVNEHQEAGRYSIQWDGKNESGHALSSGVYFYRISGSYNAMKKMLMIK